MATKKTAKKTAAKKTAPKKATKKSEPKKVDNQESLISKEVEEKLEEQKEIFSSTEKTTSEQQPGTTDDTNKKNIFLIIVLAVILILIGYFALFKKDTKQNSEPSKIQPPVEQQTQIKDSQKESEIKTTQQEAQKPPIQVEKKYIEYTIQRGDVLSSILRKFNKTQKELQEANPEITDWNKLKVGQVIKIPK